MEEHRHPSYVCHRAIGSTHAGEPFTDDCDLPNDTMYGETCASVAMSMFAQQMLDLEPKGEYADVLEKELFNGSIAGISLTASTTTSMHWRPRLTDWITRTATTCSPTASTGLCACCPANIARLIASGPLHLHRARRRQDRAEPPVHRQHSRIRFRPDGRAAFELPVGWPWNTR
ncbi:MAG: beta-L-arabinofuranosidase domain-containing protein [Bifidobacterium sp.]